MNCPKCAKTIPDEASSCIFCGETFESPKAHHSLPQGAKVTAAAAEGAAPNELGTQRYRLMMTVLSALAVVVVLLMIGYAIKLLNEVAANQKKEQKITCIGNLHQIGVVIGQWAMDNQGTFPDGKTVWSGVKLDAKYLVCPSAKSPAANSYGYNNFLSNRSMKDFMDPESAPMVADGGNGQNLVTARTEIDLIRHTNGFNLLAASGAVRWYPSTMNLDLELKQIVP